MNRAEVHIETLREAQRAMDEEVMARLELQRNSSEQTAEAFRLAHAERKAEFQSFRFGIFCSLVKDCASQIEDLQTQIGMISDDESQKTVKHMLQMQVGNLMQRQKDLMKTASEQPELQQVAHVEVETATKPAKKRKK